jgi:uncharacterized membrane protein
MRRKLVDGPQVSQPEVDKPQEEDLGLSDTRRAEGFSDGVFAIVATLLALELKPPPGRPGQLLDELLSRWPTYLAFITSFLYVGVVWLNHKAVFGHIRAMDRATHWLNLGILSNVTLLPFPTAVIASAVESGNSDDSRVAVALYGLVGALLCASWLVFFHHLSKKPDLLHDHMRGPFYGRERVRAVAGVLLYLLGGTVGTVSTPTAMAIFLLLPVFYGLTSHGLTVLPAPLGRLLPRH